jgi:hypothetical protein
MLDNAEREPLYNQMPAQPEVTDVSWPDRPPQQEISAPEFDLYGNAAAQTEPSRPGLENPKVLASNMCPLDPASYKALVQQQLIQKHGDAASGDPIGYLDHHGYLIEWKKDNADKTRAAPESRGEATYLTAVAIIALAAGNYNPDAWETESANTAISGFLDVLLTKSWGNKDSSGQLHPIRHPDWVELTSEGVRRNRPLTKDSFGQIVLGSYYAYKCPISSGEVRRKAQQLLDKWIEYLDRHKWLLHSNYIPNEFASHVLNPSPDDPPGTEAKTVFDNLFDEQGKPITWFNSESYALTPPELFALKNCAEAIETTHRVVDPTMGFLISFGQGPVAHWQKVIEPVVTEAGKATEWLFDRLVYQRNYSIHVIPGWDKSLIKGTFAISAFGPSLTKADIKEGFEWELRNYLVGLLPDPFLSTDYEAGLAEAVEMFASFGQDTLYGVPFIGLLYEFIKQLCPWFGEHLLAEYFWFASAIYAYMGVLPKLKLDASSQNVGYFLWTVLAEMETQPALVPLLKPLVRYLFDFLAVSKDNPNTLWAWLGGNSTVVQEHMARFERACPDNWTLYAYGSTDYNKWFAEKVYVEAEDPLPSSRVDYLVLQGLNEKGHPKPWTVTISFSAFTDACSKAMEAYIKKMVLGGLQQEYIDEIGNTIVEYLPLSGPIDRIIYYLTGEKVRLSYYISVEVEKWHWSSSRTFERVEKWAKMSQDGLAHVRDLVQLQTMEQPGAIKVWKWAGSGELLEFGDYVLQYLGTSLGDYDGYNSDLKKAERQLTQIREGSGRLFQWQYERKALKSFTEWSGSTAKGLSTLKDCVQRTVRYGFGEMRQWKFDPQGGGLTQFGNWSNSMDDGSVVLEDLTMVRIAFCIQFYQHTSN